MWQKPFSHLADMIYGNDSVFKARERMLPPAGLSCYKISALF